MEEDGQCVGVDIYSSKTAAWIFTSDNKCNTKNAHKRPDRVLIEDQIFCETDMEPLQEIIGNAHMDLPPNNGHKFSN